MQTNQSKAQLPTIFTSSYTPGHYPPAPVTPGTGNRQSETSAMPPSPLELFRVALLMPIYPASPMSSHGNHHKGSCPHLSSLPPLLISPGASPCGTHAWMSCLLFLEICDYRPFMTVISISRSYHTQLKQMLVHFKTQGQGSKTSDF